MVQLPKREYASAGGVVAAGGRVLVLKRENRAGPDGRAEMRLPKGHVEPGESRAAAARREVEEEAGLPAPQVLADLGHQTVEFDWQGHHYVRDESYFLMAPAPGAPPGQPEAQFERLWLPWEEAQARLTYAAEREWLRRARRAWQALQHVADQDADQADDHPQVQ